MENRCPQAWLKTFMKYTVIVDGQRLDVELGRANPATIEAEIAGEKYLVEVRTVEPGVYWFLWNHRSIEISVTPNRDAYVVSVANQHFNVEIIDPRAALRKAAQQGQEGAVELRAPMPGKVVKVLTTEGA